MHVSHNLLPRTDLQYVDKRESVEGEYASPKSGLQYSLSKNFGEIEFDFNDRRVILRSIGENGMPLIATSYTFDQLSGRAEMPGSRIKASDFRTVASLNNRSGLPLLYGNEWVCVNHRGYDSPMSHLIGHTCVSLIMLCWIPLPLVASFLFVLSSWRLALRVRRNARGRRVNSQTTERGTQRTARAI
jgi:hypothetical protein